MKPVTLAVFNSREEAEPLRQHLCEAGIWAEIRRESGGEGLLSFARPTTGVRVEVPREDFEEALQLIYDFNAGGEVKHDEGVQGWMPWADKESRRKRDQA